MENKDKDGKTIALETVDLAVGYKGFALLSDLNLQLPAGQVVALVGRNGVGKSTLLRTLTREQKPVSGSVFIEGEDIDDLSRKQLARKLAVVTTDRDVSYGLLVREIVAMGRHPHTDLLTRFNEEDHKSVEEAMKLTGIAHKATDRFGELSDGEKQKVMIARALAQDTPVIILDEPFSFLDTAARIEILTLLKRMAAEKDTAILFSSHDVAQALRMTDFIWLLTPDRQLFRGTPRQLIADHTIDKLFNTPGVHFDAHQNDFVNSDNNS